MPITCIGAYKMYQIAFRVNLYCVVFQKLNM